MKILFVDISAIYSMILRNILIDLGKHEIIHVVDCPSAFKALQVNVPDFVIINDLVLPVNDTIVPNTGKIVDKCGYNTGLYLAQAIKKQYKDIPVWLRMESSSDVTSVDKFLPLVYDPMLLLNDIKALA